MHCIRSGALVLSALGLLCSMAPARAMFEDDPFLWQLLLDEVEMRDTDAGTQASWDAEIRAGKDLHKARLITEGQHLDGETEESELQLLYSRAVTPFGNVEIGWRRDLQPRPQRDWLVLGARWLLPWFLETEISLFAGEHGQNALRLELEYEFLLHRKLALHPHLELDFYEEQDREHGIGSGLSTLEAGLRLQYRVRREFAPYIGLHWEKYYGDSARFRRAAGRDEEHLEWVMGFNFWW